ncbi:Retrovirus-related Pol polyprotein from transposon TNT 1-94 [Araneus ventricosus]|uniref:Retrovirus-related Pol polyprotein from transposon TNT 1-94 n=1 Tax=Araneus ventricosus TaxID=182803 RepID=A0A4Y2BTZ9_ARAVE|nr:Retrovirus-related Pol polyprotein from transposon TNT 1-94 [Araneus ventricosus]
MNDKIAPLTSDNYPSWKQDMIAILLDRNVYDIVLGKENSPGDDATEKEKMRFKKRCNKAFSSIYLNVSKGLRTLIADITEGKNAWEVIQKYFHPESRARTIGLLDQFFSCRIEINEKIGLYAARLRKIIADLLDCGEKVPLKYQAFQLIRFLPDCFGAIVQAIYRWPDDQFTFDQVLNELIAEEARLEQCSRDHEQFTLHSATLLRTSTRNISKINRPQAKAKKYNKTGYSDRDYWVKKKGSPKSFIAEACITERSDPNAWIIDSAATTHFCSDRKWFTKFEPSNKPEHIYLANSDTCPIEGKGTVKLSYPNGQCFFLNNVIYSSQIRHNLISAPKLDQGGAKFIGQRRKIQVFDGKERLFTATLCSGLYKTYPKPPQTAKVTSFNTSKTEDRKNKSEKTKRFVARTGNLTEWHQKYGHINTKYIVSSIHAVRGLPILKNQTIDCLPCRLAKSRRKSFKPLGGIRSKEPLQLIYTDICGPFPKQTHNGYKYFITFIDDFSRKVTCFLIKTKNEASDAFRKYQARAERFTGKKIICIRSENGGEFRGLRFQKDLENMGIKVEFTNSHTPEENGVAERYNYTACDAIKALLNSSGLSENFWGEALLTFTYCWNRSVHRDFKKTPFELYGGFKPSVTHLKPFGIEAFVGIPKQRRSKLQMRAKRGVMVGYALQTKGYRIYLPEERRIIETINVSFGNKIYKEIDDRSGIKLDPKTGTFNYTSPQTTEEPEYEESDTSNSDSSSDEELPVSKISLSKISIQPELEQYKTASEETEDETEIEEPSGFYWLRKAVPRKNENRTDIYYCISGQKTRLRSINEVKKYCKDHELEYNPKLFNFSGNVFYQGPVKN